MLGKKTSTKTVEQQPDGAHWVLHHFESGAIAVTTAAFEQIMRGCGANVAGKKYDIRKDFLVLLGAYKRLARDGNQGKNRHKISEGKFAEFYEIGTSNMGVREEHRKGPSGIDEKIKRMDVIQHLLDIGGLPRWIQLPAHYGYITVPDSNSTTGGCTDYLLMDKIDHGVTVEDIQNGPRNDKLQAALFKKLGKKFGFKDEADENFQKFKHMVLEMYNQLVSRLRESFTQHRFELSSMCGYKGEVFCFEDLFTDLAAKNIVVDQLNPPIGGKQVGLWIIDQ